MYECTKMWNSGYPLSYNWLEHYFKIMPNSRYVNISTCIRFPFLSYSSWTHVCVIFILNNRNESRLVKYLLLSCLGNAGNVLDGYNPPTKKSSSSSDDSESEEETADDAPLLNEVSVDTPKWKSTTPILRPSTKDRMYYHLPYYEDKPCVYIKHAIEDHRRRMYNSNIVDRIIEKLVSLSILIFMVTFINLWLRHLTGTERQRYIRFSDNDVSMKIFCLSRMMEYVRFTRWLFRNNHFQRREWEGYSRN